MKIALFGGTFNPPHQGHVNLARGVWKELQPDRLLVMPTGLPPHKAMPTGSASNEERYEMTLLAFSSIPGVTVSRLELERGGASYTSDTLKTLRREFPTDELILTVGGDMFLTLDRWHEAETIFREATIAAAARNEEERQTMEEAAEIYRKRYQASVTILKTPVVEISSSEIRADLHSGRMPTLLPEAVADYIREKGLYR